MDAMQSAEQAVIIEAARAYVEDIGVIDMTSAGVLAGHLMSAEVLLREIVAAFAPINA
ncbi:hypothetical protein [Streptomyces sp. B1I3]|uniref:hypothetical protein n=1 Tax=Streptomyces sp. B1I3 TaxID=3042264 RepID=UPI0027898405|nr:hypothetical protein [Streptomyces sp. B1I3]MDQ0792011.1 hypothetical protein [Streptomyces sp. B1I3]